jgi:flagellar biosynthesis protein FlhA
VTNSDARGGRVLVIAVLSIVAMLVVPLPPFLLDALLALDVMGACAVLVTALSVQDPLELSAFPSLVLIATLFRLSLDVSATRLILTQGDLPGGAGEVIPAFGQFVMRGNVVVGLLLFVILLVVQLAVVANGTQRVAEVAARFTLDAMPGKQMAIDADLHAGLIDAQAARARRRAVQAEADFYGAMDGAGKFVRGDAIAAVVIVAVNLIAGFAIGVLQKHLDAGAAVQTFALLSIGNALATTVPSFLISTAAGVMVTRAASDASLGDDLARQLSAHPGATRSVGGAMLALAFVPGAPHLAFGALGLAGLGLAQASVRANESRARAAAAEETQRRRADARKPESAVALVGVEQLSIDVGEALLPLLDDPAGSALLARIAGLRTKIALDLGVVLPGVRVRDDLRLPPRAYAIRVRDRVAARGELHPDRALAIGPRPALSHLSGDWSRDPVTGSDARWIPAGDDGSTGSAHGAIVVDPIGVLASALGNVVRAHAHALLGRQEVQSLLDHVRRTYPAAIKGVVPELASLGLVQRVLQHLVRESVSIRDIVAVLETIADEAEATKDASIIGEAARRRLAPVICSAIAHDDGTIRAIALAPELEHELIDAVVTTERGPFIGVGLESAERLRTALADAAARRGGCVVLVCGRQLRSALARFAEIANVRATVLALDEVAPGYALAIEEALTA